MKKILVVTTKPPFPLFSGDRLRIYNISKHLSKKNKVDLIYTGSKEKFKKKINFINKLIFIRTNIIKRIFYTLFFLLKGKPLQVGFFFSQEMKKKIYSIYENYDCIIFHLVRASEFLPKNYKGTTVLEMTDLISENYLQLFKKFSFLKTRPVFSSMDKKKLIDFLKKENNDLEETVSRLYPKIIEIINFVKVQNGCFFSRITGSGSACIGIFSTNNEAISTKKLVKLKFPKYWCVVSKTI